MNKMDNMVDDYFSYDNYKKAIDIIGGPAFHRDLLSLMRDDNLPEYDAYEVMFNNIDDLDMKMHMIKKMIELNIEGANDED